ncbi:unnamed protein product [Closterium sp. NIES-53]
MDRDYRDRYFNTSHAPPSGSPLAALLLPCLHRPAATTVRATAAAGVGATRGGQRLSLPLPDRKGVDAEQPTREAAEGLHTFTLDSSTPRCFFHDCTSLTPLAAPVPVSLADPIGGPVVARASTVLPCPAVTSGSLSGLHLPTFSTNLVSNAAIQDVWVDTFIPGGQRVAICTCSRTSRPLATFTRRPGSSLYTLTTTFAQVAEAGQVAASSQVSASGQLAASCSCRVLSHQTLLWHHSLSHPSLPRLRGMHSRLLVSGLPRSLPSLPRSPTPPCFPCVEKWQRAASHSSEFPPTTAPLQTLHMDVWGPARVDGTDQERYFLLVVDEYTRYTTVFPLRRKADVSGVLIPWIRATRRQLCERFNRDFPIFRLHSDRGGEFSSDLLVELCQDEGIVQLFTLPASPHQNGIAEHRIGLIMEVDRTSMIHATSPHFLWPFAARYAAHQLNLWPHVYELETSPTLPWTEKVGDVLVFRVWDALSLVRDSKENKLSFCTLCCVFLGFPIDAPSWQFYHPRSRRGLAPSGVSQVDPPPLVEPLEIYSDSSGLAEGGDPATDDTAATCCSPRLEIPPGFPPRLSSLPLQSVAVGSRAETAGVEPGGAETEGEGSGGAASGGAGSWVIATGGADSGGPAHPCGGGAVGDPTGGYGPVDPGAAGPGGTRTRGAGAGGAGGAVRAGGATGAAGSVGTGGTTGARGTGGTGGAGAAGPGGARTRGTGAAGVGGAAGAGGATGATGTGGAGGTTGARGPHAAGASDAASAGGARGAAGAVGAGGAGATGAGGAGAVGTALCRPFFYPQPQSSLTPPDSVLRQVLTSWPENLASTPVRAPRVASSRPFAVPGTHGMAIRPSFVPQCLVLLEPPASSLPHVLDPESDLALAASPTVIRLLATVVTDPEFQSTAAFALVTELIKFAARSRLDYIASLLTEFEQFELECLVAALPCFASMLLCPEGDPDALDIPTPRSYAEAIADEYSSQWRTAMDAEMASWKSTRSYVDEVPPPRVNIVNGMWIFKGVDFFQTFSPTPKMTTLWVLLHVAAQHDYELHSLEFSTDILQGGLHEEISLRCPPDFTGSFPAGTQWSLWRPVYSLRQAPQEWHNTPTTLAALGFSPSTADPSLFLRTGTTLLPFYIIVYVNDLVFAIADTEALALVLQSFGFQFSSPQPTTLSIGHSLSAPPSDESAEPSCPYPELLGCVMYLMTCTRPDLAYPLSLLARCVAPGRHQKGSVLLTGHSDASWADNQATQYSSQGYTFSLGLVSVSWSHEHRLEHKTKHIALRYFLARELQQRCQLRLSYEASRANIADVFTKALGSGDHQRFCTALGLVPTLPHLLFA